MNASDDPGFGIYLHWPFCAAKCPYCDFNSHVRHQGIDEPRFAKAFAAEIAHAGRMAPDRVVTSIFLGGGTPSLMKPETVAALLDAVAATWTIAPGAEVTLEANPSSVEAGRFAGYRTAGVNRVSLGVQALDDVSLKALGRLHDAEQALAAIAVAQRTFERSSFDLIYARPGQSADDWRAELARGLALAGEHLSLYELTIEPGTAYAGLHAAGKLAMPDDDTAAALYEITQEVCEAHGLPAYEVSNHARPGAESRHNLVYWRGGAYVGVGPGAHGRLRGPDGWVATATDRHPERWLAKVEAEGHGLVEQTRLAPAERADEVLLMGMRLTEGVDPARYAAEGGRPVSAERRAALEAAGLLVPRADGRLVATSQGRLVLNALIAELAA